MKFGDNDNAMGVGYGTPEVSTESWSFWSYGKVSLVFVHEIW